MSTPMSTPTRPRSIQLTRLTSLSREIERRTMAIGRERDALRALVADANDIVESSTEAIGELKGAVRSIDAAVDELSRYL